MRFLVPLPFVVVLVALLWFGFGRNPANVSDPLVGRRAPLFILKSANGQTISLRHLRGRPVVLSFFASWCTSCQANEGNLVQAYRQYHRQVRFVGVIYEDSPALAASFTRAHGGRWPDLIDPHSNVAIAYGISGIPTTFFINARGIITGLTFGLLPDSLDQGIQTAMGAL